MPNFKLRGSKFMKELDFYIKYCITVMILSFAWLGLEYTLDGEIISQMSDTVIAFISGYFITDWFNRR